MNNLYYRLLSDNSLWSAAEARFAVEAPIEATLTELADVDELRKCLRFYTFNLGELAEAADLALEIKAALNALDAEYLTPRVLAGLATGDDYALARLAAHEEKAIPFRHEMMRLSEVAR